MQKVNLSRSQNTPNFDLQKEYRNDQKTLPQIKESELT